ncbi:MAG: hypothetical protein AAF533_23155, partial [Acidobacteriota bacterium]
MCRIKRQIGATCFEHGDQRDDQLGRTLKTHANNPLRTHAQTNEVPGQLVRGLIQRAISQCAFAIDDGNTIWPCLCLLLKQINDRHVTRIVRIRVVEDLNNLTMFTLIHQPDIRNP